MRKLNVKLLRRVKREILKEPRRFDMGTWVNTQSNRAPCGTAACIAGWAAILSKSKGKPITSASLPHLAKKVESVDIDVAASKALGIDYYNSERLFSVTGWPVRFFRKYRSRLSGGMAAAKVAAERIEHYIKTNGKE